MRDNRAPPKGISSTSGRILLVALLAAASGAWKAEAQEPLFLWKASSNAGEVYLLGSLHLATPDMYPLDERIEQALRDSDSVVVEVDTSSANQDVQEAIAMERGVYTDGSTLSDHLSPEALRRVQAFVQEKQLPMALFQPLRPWTVAATLQVLEMQRFGFDSKLGLERHFLRLASQQGKAVHELESAELQLETLAGMPADLQELFLVSTVEAQADLPERMDRMFEAWRTGDTADLEDELLGEYQARPEMFPLYKRIVVDRNVGMAERIVEMLEGGGTWFVIAGAAHMLGEHGLVELLRQHSHGFEVVQIGSTE